MPIELSERQQSTVASALTIVSACVILVALGGVFWLIGAFFNRFSNVFLPLAVAAVAALVFKPFYELLRTRLKLAPALALIAVFLSMLIPVAGFVWFFGALIVEQVSDLVSKTPEWWQQIVVFVKERAPRVVEFLRNHPLMQQVQAAIAGQQETIVQGIQTFSTRAISAGAGLLRGVGGLLCWVVLPVYFSFFLITDLGRTRDLERYLPFLKAGTRDDVVYLVQEFIDIVVAFFRGQLVIAFLQGLLFAVGFSVVGLRYGFVIGLVLGLLNIIPYLGSIVGLGIALPLALFQAGGGWATVAWVLVVFTVVQLIEGYLLTPKIMGDRTGLHPVVIIVAVFFWGSALGGIMGMILAIPLTAFLVVFWRLAKEKYIRELV